MRGKKKTESELYKELRGLTKEKDRWEESIPYVASLLPHESIKIQAKALWLLGEMGLIYPQTVQEMVKPTNIWDEMIFPAYKKV